MAKQAYMVDEKGAWKLVHCRELTEEERKGTFFCCGCTPNGETCGVPVQASEESDVKESYFYQRFRNQPHKPGCSNNRANSKSVVEKLDQRGAGLTTQKLYEKLSRDKVARKKKKRDTPDDYSDEQGVENPDEDNGAGGNDGGEEKKFSRGTVIRGT